MHERLVVWGYGFYQHDAPSVMSNWKIRGQRSCLVITATIGCAAQRIYAPLTPSLWAKTLFSDLSVPELCQSGGKSMVTAQEKLSLLVRKELSEFI